MSGAPALLVRPLAAVRRALAHPLDPPSAIVLGAAVIVLSIPAIVLVRPDVAIAVDNAQQLAATIAGVSALVLATLRGPARRRWLTGGLTVGIAFAGVAMLLWGIHPEGSSTPGGPAYGLFIVAIAIFAVTLGRAVVEDAASRRMSMALDALVVVASTATFLTAMWQTFLDPGGLNVDAPIALGGSIATVAGPVAIFLVLLDARIQPGVWGPYAVIDGLSLAGLSWIGWLVLLAHSATASVSAVDFGYSAGVLLFAYGGITWDDRPPTTAGFRRFAAAAVDGFPVLAVAVCVLLDIAMPRRQGIDVVEVGTASVVALALLRQVLLTLDERRARLAERDASARLAREIRDRADVLRSLAHLDAADTPEETARRICHEAVSLDGVGEAVLGTFEPDGRVLVIGTAGLGEGAGFQGTRLGEDRSAYLADRAAGGPWVQVERIPDEEGPGSPVHGRRRAMANAPLVWKDRIVGVIGLGVESGEAGDVLAERLTTVREFGVVAGALLGPALEARRARAAMREAIARIIEAAAFHPVFQPIHELASGRIVGYEALTRFDDGRPPDGWFADAAEAGLGIELECATLRAAIRDSIALPSGTYVSLNVSPDLARAAVPLVAALEGAERDMVLEVTEHAPIASYAGLRNALQAIRGQVRIAVDDAGAGYAGLQHILEIRPDLVKLDVSLVRSVDVDPVRRALIQSMVAFGHESGCLLLAEGVETPGELEALLSLGVSYGQGYLLGRPAGIDAIVESAPAGSAAPLPPLPPDRPRSRRRAASLPEPA